MASAVLAGVRADRRRCLSVDAVEAGLPASLPLAAGIPDCIIGASGAWGAVTSGLRHGLFCLGCCWMLMALLFVGGLMNLLWIAALALLVLIEKTLPWGGRMSRVTGAALVAWGAVTLATAFWPHAAGVG